jgi:laccase
VDVVFQSTAMMAMDSNPMHLHGHNMFVLAQGNGNYNATRDVQRYNLVDPPVRNTVQVPGLGWTAIRFVADNPGMYNFSWPVSYIIYETCKIKLVLFT